MDSNNRQGRFTSEELQEIKDSIKTGVKWLMDNKPDDDFKNMPLNDEENIYLCVEDNGDIYFKFFCDGEEKGRMILRNKIDHKTEN